MANKDINNNTLYGVIKTWSSNFVGGQAWTKTQDVYGGYGGWSAGSGYVPYVDTANGIIKWQSTTNWYYGWTINHWVETSTTNILPSIVDGTLFGYMGTSYHTQTTSYNLFSTNSGYGADETSTYTHIRNTTGLSFTACSYGGYYGSYTQFKAYCNNVLLGTIGSISNCNTYYTIKFRLQGNILSAYVGAGDLRSTSPALTLISNSVPYATLTGRNNIIYMSSWITNDQGESCYGQINSIDLRNYS